MMAGWGFPLLAKKAHYFNDDLVSLCRKWMFSGELVDIVCEGYTPGPDDCADCAKRVAKLIASKS